MHLNLLLFAAQTALTTGVCIAEYRSWPELSATEKATLGQLYIPYFVFGKPYPLPFFSVGRSRPELTVFPVALVMLIDMYIRVRGQLKGTKVGREQMGKRL